MKLRSFIGVLGIVALVAIIYSPSTIGIAPGNVFGTSSPTNSAANGASQFLSYLRQTGHRVIIANDTSTEEPLISNTTCVLMLIGLDTPLSQTDTQAVEAGYSAGRVSLLIAEGNTTNELLINSLFNATVTGLAINDPLSSFKDSRVFVVSADLGGQRESGVVDIASPIVQSASQPFPISGLPSRLVPVASTSPLSTDAGNSSVGQRVVMATSTAGSARSLLITDSAPFANYLFKYNQTVDEKKFVGAMVDWVTASSPNEPIIYDNYHYQSQTPPFGVNLHVGPLLAYVLEQDFANLDKYYTSFPSQVQGFLQGFGVGVSDNLARVFVSLVVLVTVFGAVARWYAPEQRGKDDLPVPEIETAIVAESASRVDFLTTARNKSFYVATLARLYELLDDISRKEFGAGADMVTSAQLEAKLGREKGQEALRLLAELRKVYGYAQGDRRFMVPPVLSWKGKVSRLTREAEDVLNQLGMTMTGAGEANRPLEYSMRRR